MEKKVTSRDDSNLRGGNFVLDRHGQAATLCFPFKKDGRFYGLTTGHLANVGDPILVFMDSTPTANDFVGQTDDIVDSKPPALLCGH